jgi:hypothetical protein
MAVALAMDASVVAISWSLGGDGVAHPASSKLSNKGLTQLVRLIKVEVGCFIGFRSFM